jgi:hypothetical protein
MGGAAAGADTDPRRIVFPGRMPGSVYVHAGEHLVDIRALAGRSMWDFGRGGERKRERDKMPSRCVFSGS